MADRKIQMVVMEGLTVEDVLKLRAGGFFDSSNRQAHAVGAPAEVGGQQVTLNIRDDDPPPLMKPTDAVVEELREAKLKRHTKAEMEVSRASESTSTTTPAGATDLPGIMTGGPNVRTPPSLGGPRPGGSIDFDKLAGMVKLREVLEHLTSAGVPAAGLLAECERVKDRVPLLTKIADLAPRIERAISVMGLD